MGSGGERSHDWTSLSSSTRSGPPLYSSTLADPFRDEHRENVCPFRNARRAQDHRGAEMPAPIASPRP